MARQRQSRSEERAGIRDPIERAKLLETDVDGIEDGMGALAASVATNTKVMIGLLVTIAGSSAMLAIAITVSTR